MYKIDWGQFVKNVANHVDARDKSWDEFMAPYVSTDPDRYFSVTPETAADWGKVVFDPDAYEREVLLRLIDAQLLVDDERGFGQAIEGDMCEATINLAGRLERGEGMNTGDCDVMLCIMLAAQSWILSQLQGDELERAKERMDSGGLLDKLAAFKSDSNIYNDLLC